MEKMSQVYDKEILPIWSERFGRLLLRGLAVPERAMVLDFGCGIGVLGAHQAQAGARIELLDIDAVALHASSINLPGARVWLSDGWQGCSAHGLDRIVSNPPLHRGHARDHSVLDALVREAPARLAPGGDLWVVTQRQVPMPKLLGPAFREVELVWENNRFRAWCACRGRRVGA